MQDFRIGRGRLDTLIAELTGAYARLEEHANAMNHYSDNIEMRHYFGTLVMDDKATLRRIRRRITRLLLEFEDHTMMISPDLLGY